MFYVRLVREDCTDKGMPSKEGTERRREHSARNGEGDEGTKHRSKASVARVGSMCVSSGCWGSIQEKVKR